MGLLWWKNKDDNNDNNNNKTQETNTTNQQQQKNNNTTVGGGEVAGMNGAEEVKRPRPSEVTVFEFGSVGASTDKVTIAGYCPVSEDLEPCRWEILPAQDSDAPQFRVVF